MAVGASVLATTKKFGTSFLSQQLLDPCGSIRRRRSPWTLSMTPRLSSSPGSCADLLLCCNSNKFLTTAPSFFLSSSSQGSSACHVLITVVAANQSQRRRSKSKASPPVVSGSNGLDQVEVSSTDQQFASRGRDLDGKEGDLSQLQPDGAQLIASRSDVLRACVSTSAGIALAGACIRQASHWAAVAGGWDFPDCTVLMPYDWEVSHLGTAIGSVVVVASMRQLLASLWPAYAQSSNAANKQVLGLLEPFDYLLVSFLPGISEELLFRGALLPLIAPDWRGVAISGIVFGTLHLSGGRNSAFALWASFVGVLYGAAALSTTNVAVPMIAHSIANLIAAVQWKLENKKEIET
ncbi:unnamed protein product [Sphagnum jensenii]|uniref:CAAX prenyl protease 2/Lysostaphin resistance protein A-like domain-containing protein n=1 Tax=Sphagnum jensenii TaxID=128206 RepID=A0ABP1B6P1_9BRYO